MVFIERQNQSALDNGRHGVGVSQVQGQDSAIPPARHRSSSNAPMMAAVPVSISRPSGADRFTAHMRVFSGGGSR